MSTIPDAAADIPRDAGAQDARGKPGPSLSCEEAEARARGDTSALRRALLFAAATVTGLSAFIFYLNILSVSNEAAVRREITAIYDLQLHAQKITALGHELLAAEERFRREGARMEIAQHIAHVRRIAERERVRLNPLIDLVAVGLDREGMTDAYDDLERRLRLLSRSAEGVIFAESELDMRFALSSVRAQTLSDLTVDLAAISAWYGAIAERTQRLVRATQLAALPCTVFAFWFVWLAAIKPALARERAARACLVQSEARALALAERAEGASHAKSQFLATMSHEIRTPMNGMIALIDVLEKDPAPQERARLLAVIRNAGRLLEDIVNDILDFSKIEAGELTLETVAFDPAAVVEQVAASQVQAARERGLRLSTTMDRGAIGRRLGDPLRLRQVLTNLLHNAIKFTEEGAVAIALHPESPTPGEEALRITVRDNGIGMTEAQIASAFDTFSQADGSTTRRFGGSGLGLAIVRRLVALMGGTIGIESAPGQGTTICVCLSLPHAPAAAIQAGEARVDSAALDGLRVLAADDNRTNRIVLERLLSHLGCIVTVVEGGAEAVALASKQPFAIVLLDISMPGMDGVEALAAIRADERAHGRSALPAVAVTANAFSHQVDQYLAAGFAAHVAKPLRSERLRDAIARIIAEAEEHRPARVDGP